MTKSERHQLVEWLLSLQKELLRTQARTKALEAILAEATPEAERSQWYDRLEELTRHYHQKFLASIEDRAPFVAAELDDRADHEI